MGAYERMTVVVPDQMAAKIHAAVEAGEYASASEVVRDAMRLWSERREFRQEEIAGAAGGVGSWQGQRCGWPARHGSRHHAREGQEGGCIRQWLTSSSRSRRMMILNDSGAPLRSTMTMPPIACSDAFRMIFVGWGFPVFSARRTAGSRQERPSPTSIGQHAAKSS